jgi:hypothetical protein
LGLNFSEQSESLHRLAWAILRHVGDVFGWTMKAPRPPDRLVGAALD